MSEANSVKIDVFNKALDHAALEVSSWLALLKVDHDVGIKFSADPESKKREFGNIERLLTGIVKNIQKMKIEAQP
jgi:hypothetical protein